MTQPNQQLLQGIDTVIMRVSDFNRSKNWYEQTLGLLLIWNDERMQLAVFNSNGPTSLTIWKTESRPEINRATASYPIFRTHDAPALREVLLQKGIKADQLIRDDHVIYFVFYDPDGNVMEACQPLMV